MGDAGDLDSRRSAALPDPSDGHPRPHLDPAGDGRRYGDHTRDKATHTRTPEIAAVVSNNARMLAITSEEPRLRWGLLEVIVSRWREPHAVVMVYPTAVRAMNSLTGNQFIRSSGFQRTS
jgi:hypothetical protein